MIAVTIPFMRRSRKKNISRKSLSATIADTMADTSITCDHALPLFRHLCRSFKIETRSFTNRKRTKFGKLAR